VNPVDGDTLLVGCQNKGAVTMLADGTVVTTFDSGWNFAIAWSHNGELVATGRFGRPYSIQVWSVRTGELHLRLEGHTSNVMDLAFVGPGRLASASKDNSVRVFDVSGGGGRGTVVHEWKHGDWQYAVACSPGGVWLASGGDDRHVHTHDLRAPSGSGGKGIDVGSTVGSLAFRPGDANTLAAGLAR